MRRPLSLRQREVLQLIDFVGKVDGEAFEGGSAQDIRLKLGSGQFIPGFEDQLTGVKKGEEKTIDVTFPEDYGAEHLAGKAATFDVTVKAVLNGDKPKVDEDFAKSLGLESLDKLNELQVEPILDRLDETMQTSQQTLEQVRQIAESVNSIVSDPATQQLPGNLNDTLQELQNTLNGFSAGSSGYRQLNDTLKQLEMLTRDLQPVAKTLSEKPNALIFDREVKTDPVPRAPQ